MFYSSSTLWREDPEWEVVRVDGCSSSARYSKKENKYLLKQGLNYFFIFLYGQNRSEFFKNRSINSPRGWERKAAADEKFPKDGTNRTAEDVTT